MPSNKSTRKTVLKTKSISASKIAIATSSSRVANFLQPHTFIEKSSQTARDSLNRMVAQTGNFQDWNNVLTRLYAGSIASTDYFKVDEGIRQCLEHALASMQVIMVRTHCTAVFGVKPTEHDRITNGLILVDKLIRSMSANEVIHTYNEVGFTLDKIVADNKIAVALFEEKQAMLRQLAEEYQQTNLAEESCCV